MKSTTILFKPLEPTDLALMHVWFHKPSIKQWYTRNENYTRDMIDAKYLPRIRNPENIPNFIIYADNHPVGYIQLYSTSYALPDGVTNYSHPLFAYAKPENIAGLDMFIAEDAFLGKGYATLALQNFITEHVKGKFSMLVVDPLKENTHAIQFFQKNGFAKLPDYQSHLHHELLILHVN